MKKTSFRSACLISFLVVVTGCASAYKAKPLPFKTPEAYNNEVEVAGVKIGGQAYVNKEEAKKAFGFDIRAAGMLPVQVVFDNIGNKPLVINPSQTFLVDDEGNLWPILSDKFAYERATKYAQTNKIFQEGAYSGFLGATAGAIIGSAIGIVTNEEVLRSAGKGAAIGAAAGAVGGGLSGAAASRDARSAIVRDLEDKSLKNKAIKPGNLSYGIIFFPGEAQSAKTLRLQLKDESNNETYTVMLKLS
ncbi:MAG: glycine zipper domain-containing protein [Desulfosarcinaceae bacterium]